MADLGTQPTGHGISAFPIPELGFVRVSVHRAAGAIAAKKACSALEGMMASLGKTHSFIPDDLRGSALPVWCKGAARTTDAYLLALANTNGAKLAALDTGIPDAFVVPARIPAIIGDLVLKDVISPQLLTKDSLRNLDDVAWIGVIAMAQSLANARERVLRAPTLVTRRFPSIPSR
jgi:hypothetical protein